MPERVVVIHNAAPPCALSGHYFPLTAWNTRVTPQDDVVETLREALKFYADLANPRAWCQPVEVDAQWSHNHNHRPVGGVVPSEALLEDRGNRARACLEAIRVGGGM